MGFEGARGVSLGCRTGRTTRGEVCSPCGGDNGVPREGGRVPGPQPEPEPEPSGGGRWKRLFRDRPPTRFKSSASFPGLFFSLLLETFWIFVSPSPPPPRAESMHLNLCSSTAHSFHSTLSGLWRFHPDTGKYASPSLGGKGQDRPAHSQAAWPGAWLKHAAGAKFTLARDTTAQIALNEFIFLSHTRALAYSVGCDRSSHLTRPAFIYRALCHLCRAWAAEARGRGNWHARQANSIKRRSLACSGAGDDLFYHPDDDVAKEDGEGAMGHRVLAGRSVQPSYLSKAFHPHPRPRPLFPPFLFLVLRLFLTSVHTCQHSFPRATLTRGIQDMRTRPLELRSAW